jgi:nucleoside-diphosphate-sugar epimerase/2-polyprenyl-3-methyl-5-hydroxy-6-metoxy-1,4-benzoquinol methylase
MRVLITGGTGFIGSRLTEVCRRAGHEVTALGQANTPAEAANVERLERAGARVVNASVADPDALEPALAGAEVVFHLAAAQHEMNVPDAHFRRVNVEGTRNVLDAALRQGVRRVVHGSTIGVYGSVDGVIDEDTPCRPDNIYGVTKLEGERLALSYGDRVELVVVRIPEAYGPGDRRLLKLFRAIERGKFINIGPGQNLHHPMYVDDLTAALLSLALHPEAPGKVFLLAGREAVSTNDMVVAVAAAVDTAAPKLRLPLAPLLGVATLMEVTLRPLGIQPPLHRRRMDFFRKTFSLRPTRAAELGIVPHTSFREGARATAEWYRAAGLLRRHDGAGPIESRLTSSPGSGAMRSTVTPTDASPLIDTALDDVLAAQMEPFDSFWEAPTNIEKGYRTFGAFYRHNYLRWIPKDRSARILVISCGPGYFVNLLRREGYANVVGIDSFPDKVAFATRHGLDCRVARAFGFLTASPSPWDVIIAEQELNHLTKEEILRFMTLCRDKLSEGGTVIVHAINGAHPIVGSESRWGNFDHYNAWTQYSLHQVLEHTGYQDIRVFPLNLYVFWTNPFNYVALAWDTLLRFFFLICFKMVGKSNTLFSKKIGAVGRKPPAK